MASRLGYHTVMLAYRNEAPVAANPPAGCGSNANPSDPPDNCAINIRTEILDGVPKSDLVSINAANSIDNRLRKLLRYLAVQHPADGWGNFADANGEPQVGADRGRGLFVGRR